MGNSSRTEILPSWNEGEAKQSILDFVQAVNSAGIPDDDRIVVTDNDGTLWSEKPAYFQLFFMAHRLAELLPGDPGLRGRCRALLEEDLADLAAGGNRAIVDLARELHAGETVEEYAQAVKEWITTATHPTEECLYTDLIFQPMLELLQYFRDHRFRIFIVSGGGIEFMRPWAEQAYGVPPEQVVGTSVVTEFRSETETGTGKPALVRLPEVHFVDDGVGKPVGINQHIGRRPLAALGNSNGDKQMLEWVTAGDGPRFGLLVHHTDGEDEWAYDSPSNVGELTPDTIEEAGVKGWTVVDMAVDWNYVSPPK